jgi:hypothetical protein
MAIRAVFFAEYQQAFRRWIDRCVMSRWTHEDPGPKPKQVEEMTLEEFCSFTDGPTGPADPTEF